MTPLQQTALDFCRECLGWETPTESMWGQCSNGMVVLKRGRSVVRRLRYTDLNAVMDAVRGWCGQHGYGIEMHYNRGQWFTCVDIVRHTEEMGNYGNASDPCHALMLSCLAANRKLKGISHD